MSPDPFLNFGAVRFSDRASPANIIGRSKSTPGDSLPPILKTVITDDRGGIAISPFEPERIVLTANRKDGSVSGSFVDANGDSHQVTGVILQKTGTVFGKVVGALAGD